MFYGYGADVLAVEEGVVTYTRDGIPDNQPVLGEGGKAPVVTRDTVSGNWIALDLGSNRYAFYTHLHTAGLRGCALRARHVRGAPGREAPCSGASGRPRAPAVPLSERVSG
jgi:hypothetical protein